MQPTRTSQSSQWSAKLPSQPGFSSRTAGAERRHRGRQTATGSVLISPGNEGTLVDWSAGGFAVESNLAVRVGGTYRLRCWLGETSQPFAGIVRWSRLSRTVVEAGTGSGGDVTPVFRSGFELVELPTSIQTGVSCPDFESPISSPPGKYSCHRRLTRSEISSEQNSSSGKPGLTRASITIGIR